MRWLSLLVLATAAVRAGGHAHHIDSVAAGDAQIVVTINPEARVSAVLNAPLPTPGTCGSSTAINVKVINQGFVTAPLRASMIGDGARHATLHMDSTKLSGEAEDRRTLHLVLFGPGPVDVTIAFSIDHGTGDLAGRDQVHFLVRCDRQSNL